ncbi:unnamed protein product [Parajaminaea phylloscopi]
MSASASSFTQQASSSNSALAREQAVFDKLELPLTAGKTGELPGIFDGEWKKGQADHSLQSRDPATGRITATVQGASDAQVKSTLAAAEAAFKEFRKLPPPSRGQVLRDLSDELSANKEALGALISLEMGKVLSEGKGEVQEVIDIADVAVGLSRTMSGSYLPSERPAHIIAEHPNPLGVVGVVTAFNFPVAVHGWNYCLSFVSGNATVWKPAPSTPLTAIATTKLIARVLARHQLPTALAALVCGDVETSKALCEDDRVQLLSFTGSEAIGRIVAQTVGARLGKCLLELGGNNAAIVLDDANLEIAVPGIAFAAVGTTGQRCTTTRRLFLQRGIADRFLEKLVSVYKQIEEKGLIGSPLHDSKALAGPLHSQLAVSKHNETLQGVKQRGGKILFGEDSRVKNLSSSDNLEGGNWVFPAIVMPKDAKDSAFQEEVFCPILNVCVFDKLEEAIELNNSVRQGLSSTIFTSDHISIGQWLGAEGSDCGIVNVNVSTSGAEVGAGFGGNKATGWGRECGGDAWKQYCRWSTSAVNYSSSMPLAQGVKFHL